MWEGRSFTGTAPWVEELLQLRSDVQFRLQLLLGQLREGEHEEDEVVFVHDQLLDDVKE